jgi:xanthine dehydrogenase accessory factor
MKNFWAGAYELQDSGTPFVVVTMLSSRGHAPQDPGAKALISGEGLVAGTVGGGKVEARCIEHAKERLARVAAGNVEATAPELVTWNLQRDVGMSCGGEVTYLFEAHSTLAWKIAIFGAGHVAQALVRALEPLACRITVVESRPEWLERLPSSPKIRRVLVAEPADGVAGIEPGSFFAVMTRGHATDVPVLRAIQATHPDCAYVGVIGSDVKAIRIRSELKAEELDSGFIEKLRCPMGLPFGGNDPAEIALSIAAELLQERDRTREGAAPSIRA